MDIKLKVALHLFKQKIKQRSKEKVTCQERDLLEILIIQVDVRNVIRRLKNQDKLKNKLLFLNISRKYFKLRKKKEIKKKNVKQKK